MYLCNDCEKVFEEFGILRDKIGDSTDSLAPGYLEYEVCPHCGSDDWDSVSWCKNCESNYTKDDYCDSCLECASHYLHECIHDIIAATKGNYDEVITMLKDFIEEK